MNKSVVCYGGSMSDKDSSEARLPHPRGMGTLHKRRLLSQTLQNATKGPDKTESILAAQT